MLHLQKLIRGPLNMLADLMSVRRPIQKRFQDHHVQRSLQNGTALLRLFRHGRHSTLNKADGSHSTINSSRYVL